LPINKYMINDLMHILKDINHDEKDKFINILNNEYLYRKPLANKYIKNIDDYHLERYNLFINRLHTGTKNNNQIIEAINMLKNRNDKVRNKTFRIRK